MKRIMVLDYHRTIRQVKQKSDRAASQVLCSSVIKPGKYINVRKFCMKKGACSRGVKWDVVVLWGGDCCCGGSDIIPLWLCVFVCDQSASEWVVRSFFIVTFTTYFGVGIFFFVWKSLGEERFFTHNPLFLLKSFPTWTLGRDCMALFQLELNSQSKEMNKHVFLFFSSSNLSMCLFVFYIWFFELFCLDRGWCSNKNKFEEKNFAG